MVIGFWLMLRGGAMASRTEVGRKVLQTVFAAKPSVRVKGREKVLTTEVNLGEAEPYTPPDDDTPRGEG